MLNRTSDFSFEKLTYNNYQHNHTSEKVQNAFIRNQTINLLRVNAIQRCVN